MQERPSITIAIPKGRLSRRVFSYFAEQDIVFTYNERALIVENEEHRIKMLLVKNMDLAEYVHGGIAHIGVVGSDVLYESPHSFFSLGTFPFGSTSICLITTEGAVPMDTHTKTTVASKYVKYTHSFLLSRGIHASIIPLHGSVELAPMLGLAPYIVDLVETGQTIAENGLVIAEEIGRTTVQCIANKALYKLNYQVIDTLIRRLKL